MHRTIAISSRRVVTPEGVRRAAILIRGERISEVVEPDDVPSDVAVRDFGDAVIMPGLVDPHVHINEPGRTEWEGFRTATKAAAAGGVTTVIDMPLNSTPVTISAAALAEKRQAAADQLFVDCGFLGGLVPGNEDRLEQLIESGVFGIKTFLIESGVEDFPATDRMTLSRSMSVIASYSIPLLAHAEIRRAEVMSHEADWTDYSTYLASRPESWETEAISMLTRLATQHGCRTHIVHLSAASALPIIREAKRNGALITAEVCPHHLYFDAESIERGQTLLKCAPPIRSRSNNDRLLDALLDGQIDFVASDHSPTVPSNKALTAGDFRLAWGGIASIQLRLPVLWTLVRSRGGTLLDLSRWLAQRPAEFLGLEGRKGRIQEGQDADFAIWDPEASFIVKRDELYDRHRLTPYEGEILSGAVKATYLRGKLVFENGSFGEPVGRTLARN